MIKKTLALAGAMLIVASVVTIAFGSAAQADGPTTVDATIGQGSNGVTIGDASIVRTLFFEGNETLTVDLEVPGGDVGEVHVCVGTSPFTSRIPPGRCQYNFTGLSGPAFHAVIDLGTSYVGQMLYLQIHLDLGDETAYACWRAGSPFYGNCEIDSTDTPIPVGAIGALGLSGGLGLVLVATQWARHLRRPKDLESAPRS